MKYLKARLNLNGAENYYPIGPPHPPPSEGEGGGEDFTLGEILQLSRKNLFKLIESACIEYSDQFFCSCKVNSI
jgi:hypothetical protein